MGVTRADWLGPSEPHPRPAWRGRMHTWAFLVAIPAGAVLVAMAPHPTARAAAAIYAITLTLVFGTSAAYHRLARSPGARRIMQRLDHSMIYLLIAGTYTPFCLVALPPRWGVPILSCIAAAALAGIGLKVFAFDRAERLSYALYPVMGWAGVPAAPVLVRYLSAAQAGLVAIGGIAYTLGVVVLHRRRPDPWPASFGYHEIWHVLTIVAATAHFAAITALIG